MIEPGSGNDSAVSRRRFLTGAAVLVGLPLLGTPMLTACAKDDTATASTWFEPTVRSSENGVLRTQLRVADGEVAMGSGRVRGVTYEGTYPGPTLDVRPGDRVEVALINDLGEPTNLHTHGWHVSPKQPSDDVLMAVEPGETYDYAYDLPANHSSGTFWYHSHQHSLSDTQVFAGLFGALIVRGELDDLPGVRDRTERLLVLSQTEIADGEIVPGDKSSNNLQQTLVNGTFQPTTEIAPGEVQRWRILNASSLFLRLQLDGHSMHVIAVDGDALTSVSTRDVVEIVPGGRLDVLVQGANIGTYQLRSLSWEEFGPFYSSMVPAPMPLLNLVSSGQAQPAEPLPTTLLPFDDLRDAVVDRRREFVFEELEPRGTGHSEHFMYFINGTTFDHHVVNETMKLGDTEEWHFVNRTYEPHPVHIHVNDFQVVAINDEPVDEQHYRDTAMLPPFGSLTIRHRFEDFTGRFVMHCHILFHEDHGMMHLLEVVE
ncbi:multicopper oxidase family protein [Rhodococcoides kyotonense]|uniref:Multicopper oxidase with three cupredoxin domains (Includes cell division protein FtsP and spore coat protein CotA) n=1 Tax=Rhodococcoides kyotonense TaxID=398843 RepID=A0A239M0F4_9NOCA|nr:multicopper oxidase family protein [Rhodococcus kyotonensis]SNT35424.1 Multicopper oxidase with three cupredoxin domains (includes cell division protein FtsP and spore coat protein CotA) [Rhodococcus kyotonensis]